MNLFSTGSDALSDPMLASAGWSLDVEPAKASDYGRRYVAVISRAGEEFCRMSIDPFIGEDLEAHGRLVQRARQWIADFQAVNFGQREPGPQSDPGAAWNNAQGIGVLVSSAMKDERRAASTAPAVPSSVAMSARALRTRKRAP